MQTATYKNYIMQWLDTSGVCMAIANAEENFNNLDLADQNCLKQAIEALLSADCVVKLKNVELELDEVSVKRLENEAKKHLDTFLNSI